MSLPPKVLFLLHLPPPVHGSSVVGMNIKDIILIRKDFECFYVNLLASKTLVQTGKVTPGKVFDFISIFVKVFLSIIKNKPQLCYLALTSTGLAFYRDVLLIIILKSFGIKRVYHLHNKGVSLHQSNRISRFCYTYVFKGADVILLSEYLYSDVQDFVPKSKIHICPNGISDEATHSKMQLQMSDSRFSVLSKDYPEGQIVQVLFLSNLLEAKGVFTLLDACAILAKKSVPFRCVFIGSEGDITALQFNEKASSLGLTQQVVYLGKRYGQEKHSTFAESDIFVFPTHYETFGLVNLEAMQHALPIIATLEGGIPDIIENNVTGFLVPTKDPNALADRLELLIKSPELRRQLGNAGRQKYEQEFTLEIFERTFTTILHSILYNTHKT